jgi:hypothetical protein
MKRTLVLAAILGAVWAAVAAADGGGPSPGVTFGSPGVVDKSGTVRFVSMPSSEGTTIAALGARAGRVLRWNYLHGVFGIPAVAWDGSTGGLARNGRRLVVTTGANYGSKITRFVVLNPRNLRVRSRFMLHGAFAFDAISPGGSLMYLLQYLGDRNAGRYAVRVYNLNTRELYPGALVDRREPNEKMTGLAMTRTDGPDGTWAYTLYSRTNKSPFVHALDTVHRRAFCVDLPWRASEDWLGRVRMRVSSDGTRLVLRALGKTRAVVDTHSFEVSR